MKRIYKVLIVAALLCVSVACAGYGAGNSGNKSAKEGEQRFAWPLATCSTEDTITHIFATAFAKEVGERSDGKMKIQVYPQSTLGGDRELMESCKDGDIPFVLQSPAPQVSFMPQLCVFDIPCAFESIEDARAAVDDPRFQEIVQGIYQDAGYRLLGTADQCFRVMTSRKPFTGFESFQGQKIRTMENTFHIQFWKAMGANPTPMTFSEVYIGLQQKTIDAQENAYELLVSAKLYEQQNYVIETNAVPDYTTLIVSDSFFKGLSKEQQRIIEEAAKAAQEKARKSADDRSTRRKKELKEQGMEIVTPETEVWKQMQKACEPVYQNIRTQAGDELVDLYMKAKK